MNEQQLARGLGWFSLGLGLAEFLAPRQVGRAIGITGYDQLLRMMGLREITSGVGILSRARPTKWLWSRVAGDVVDLSLLAAALASGRGERTRTTAALVAVTGVGVLDVLCSVWYSKDDLDPQWRVSRSEGYTGANRPAPLSDSERAALIAATAQASVENRVPQADSSSRLLEEPVGPRS